MIEGTGDSGIEFDIPDIVSLLSCADIEVVDEATSTEYHDLKSRVVVGSPVPEIKHSSMSMRANLRQQLQRQQMLEIEKREHQETMSKPSQTISQNIAMPIVVQTAPELPSKVLQVKTPLEHPTRYHIRQNQKRQVQMFLSQSVDHNMPAHSMPALTMTSPADAQWHISGSAPTDLDSPHGLSSHSGMEDMDLLSDLISLESVEPSAIDNDLNFIEPSFTQMSSTLPGQPAFMSQYHTIDSANATSSSSCPPVFTGQVGTPPNMSEEDARMWAKDRQKKDNHNMIERRRRFNINDRIKELGTLLPRNYDQDMRQNKGSILKASVDYIRRLRKDQDKLRTTEERNHQLEKNNQRMTLKLHQISAVLKQRGINIGLTDDYGDHGDLMVSPNIINLQTTIKTEEHLSPSAGLGAVSSFQGMGCMGTQEDFMDDSSLVSDDPMLTSAPVSPDQDDSNGLL